MGWKKFLKGLFESIKLPLGMAEYWSGNYPAADAACLLRNRQAKIPAMCPIPRGSSVPLDFSGRASWGSPLALRPSRGGNETAARRRAPALRDFVLMRST